MPPNAFEPQNYADAELASLTGLLAQRPATLGNARLVAIDGPAGSGKTTLAGELASLLARQELATTILHMDDFFEGWSGLDRSAELEARILDQVLRPLAAMRTARWQRYDWAAGRFAEWHDVPPVDVVLLEGCGSGALAYAPYLTVLVWVEASRESRLHRAARRDGEEVLPLWLGWMESEARHFAANDTARRADVRLVTDD